MSRTPRQRDDRTQFNTRDVFLYTFRIEGLESYTGLNLCPSTVYINQFYSRTISSRPGFRSYWPREYFSPVSVYPSSALLPPRPSTSVFGSVRSLTTDDALRPSPRSFLGWPQVSHVPGRVLN